MLAPRDNEQAITLTTQTINAKTNVLTMPSRAIPSNGRALAMAA